jgi:hypothetical protein
LKKVLIITNDFPPIALGSVQRICKLSKYLPRYGWLPIILTQTPKRFYARDDELLREMQNAGVVFFRTKGRSRNFLNESRVKPLKRESKRNFYDKLRQVLYIPDKQKKWKRKALKLASRIIEDEKIDLIYVTGPPFSTLLIGQELKEKYGIKLIVDYRDSWHDSPFNFYLTPFHRFFNTNKEKELLRVADKMVTVNRRVKELLIAHYPSVTHDDIMIVPHGYDKEDFISSTSQLPRTTKMRFTYAGSFIRIKNRESFFKAAAAVFNEQPELRKRIELCFLGIFSKDDLHLISKYGLKDVANVVGYVNHAEYIKYLISSDVLWLTIDDYEGTDIISTVKLYEYMGSQKPILALIPDGVAKASLKNYNAIRICDPQDISGIEICIKEYIDMYLKNSMPWANDEVIKKYDYELIVQNLARQFEFLIDVSPEFVRKDSIGITQKVRM